MSSHSFPELVFIHHEHSSKNVTLTFMINLDLVACPQQKSEAISVICPNIKYYPFESIYIQETLPQTFHVCNLDLHVTMRNGMGIV